MAQVPLAWCNLTSDRSKFLLSVLGISFAVMLLFVQLGFYYALLDSSILLIEKLNADLVVIHQGRGNLSYPRGFPRGILQRLHSVPGVQSTHSLMLDVSRTQILAPDRLQGNNRSKTPEPGERIIRVLAVDPDAEVLRIPELSPSDPRSRIAQLRIPGQALFDLKSRDKFGLAQEYEESGGEPFSTELAKQQIQIAGPFTLGRDMMAEGNLLVSETTFREYLRVPFPFLDPDTIDLGLIRLSPGANQRQVQGYLNQELDGTPMRVYSIPELINREQNYWLSSTPIGQVFFVGLLTGILVGALICYQILSSGVSDRLSEYATLRAIGYSNWYLAWVVIQEGMILAAVGFLPGWGVAWVVYQGLEWATGLPLRFFWDRVLIVLAASLFMCALSALFAVREAQVIDPAEVF